MKKLLFLFLCALMTVSLLAGCGEKTPAVSSVPEASPEATSVSAPEPEPYAPMAIFDRPFNSFSALDLPENFTPYAACFSFGNPKLGSKATYVLSMTAAGSTDEAIRFLSALSETPDDAKTAQYISDYNNYAFCEFPIEGGLCTIRKTNPDDDRYAYLEGCHIDLTANPDSAAVSDFLTLFSDNYSLAALGVAADYFDVTPQYAQYDLYVNRHKNSAEMSLCYPTLDVAAIQKQMGDAVKSNWYDAQGGKMGLSYGKVDLTLLFDTKGGCIYLTESTSDLTTALRDYTAPDLSLATLGFNYAQQDALCIYEDKAQNFSVAIHRPEWGDRENSWNIEILQQRNGYLFAIWYNADTQCLNFQADKDGTTTRFDYAIDTGSFSGDYPDADTVKARFSEVFGTTQADVYKQALLELELALQPRFGLSLQELYALPIR